MAKINPIELSSFRYGLGAFCVKQDRKKRWGIIDTDGNVVVEPCWNMVHICSPEIIVLWTSGSNNGRFFDIVRRIFIPGISYNSFCKRLITIKGNKRGLEDLNGHVLIPHKYRKMNFGDDGLIEVMDFKGKCGIFNSDGTELLPVRYDEIRMCDKTFSLVKIADKWFVADASGERPLKKQYDYLGSFNSKGYCIFGEKQIDKLCEKEYMCYGLMDKHENILIPAIYDYLHCSWPDENRFCCGRADHAFWGMGIMVNPTWRYGVIDFQGNEIVPCVYPELLRQGPDRTYIADIPRMNYRKGEVAYQPVSSQTGYVTGVVDETGRIVLPFRNWQILDAYNTAYRVYDRELELCGLYSSSGEELLPLEFEHIDVMGNTLDYIAVCKNGEWYYVNSRNERVLL